jgi:hypothetical protein
MRLRTGILLLTVWLAACPVARADPGDGRLQAETLFREGRRSAEAGDFDTACAKFAESQRLDPSTGTLLNLGDCEEHRGHLAESRNYYQSGLAQLGQSDPRVPHVKERLAGVEARMPHLTIRLHASAPPGTVVTRDGLPVLPESFGVAVPVDPGVHALHVTAPGHADRRVSIVLAEAESRDLTAQPGAPQQPTAPSGPANAPTHSAESVHAPTAVRTAGWVTGGAGAIGLVIAGLSGIVLLDERSTVHDHCPQPNACDSIGAAAVSANRTWLRVNTIAWIAGAAGVGVGAYLLITAPTPRVDVSLAAIGAGAGVRARVAF